MTSELYYNLGCESGPDLQKNVDTDPTPPKNSGFNLIAPDLYTPVHDNKDKLVEGAKQLTNKERES